MPVTRDDMRRYVTDGFAARHRPPPPAPGDETLVTVALGLLRHLNDPTGGALAALATSAFGGLSVPAQLGQKVVDYFLQGQQDSPPFPQKQEIPPTLRDAFAMSGRPVPGTPEIDVLSHVEVGILQDRFPNGPKAAKQGVADLLAAAHDGGGIAGQP